MKSKCDVLVMIWEQLKKMQLKCCWCQKNPVEMFMGGDGICVECRNMFDKIYPKNIRQMEMPEISEDELCEECTAHVKGISRPALPDDMKEVV